MHDGNLMVVVHGKNGEYTAKPASRAALVSFILRISLEEPPRAALIEPSSSTIEARCELANHFSAKRGGWRASGHVACSLLPAEEASGKRTKMPMLTLLVAWR